jgi:WD40 repeat protein
MMANLTLASASDVVNIWNINPNNPSAAYTATVSYTVNSLISVLNYNHNNSVLISGSEKSINLNYTNGQYLYTLNNDYIINDLCLTSGSRYIAVAGESSRISLYDLKKNSIIRHIDGHKANINAIDLSGNYLASAAQDGLILVHNIESGQIRNNIKVSNNSITDLQYNPSSQLQLVAADAAGYLHSVDLSSKQSYSTLPLCHSAAISAVQYNPVSHSTVYTASIDKFIFIWDLNSKNSRKAILCKEANSCMHIHSEGSYFAVGTLQGNIFVYDNRNETKPLLALNQSANNQIPVNAVKFANNTSKAGKSSNNAANNASPIKAIVASNNYSNYSAPANTNEMFKSSRIDEFSPIRTVPEASAVISPNNYTAKSTVPPSPYVPVSLQGSKTFQPANANISRTPTTANKANSIESTAVATVPANALSPAKSSSAIITINHSTPGKTPLNHSIITSPVKSLASFINSTPSTAAAAATNTPSTMPIDLSSLQSFVKQELSELKRELHTEFQNLHLDLIRQFHTQQVETANLFSQFLSQQANLIQEVKQLKADYQKLRHIY